jgi:hypothetical protein
LENSITKLKTDIIQKLDLLYKQTEGLTTQNQNLITNYNNLITKDTNEALGNKESIQ